MGRDKKTGAGLIPCQSGSELLQGLPAADLLLNSAHSQGGVHPGLGAVEHAHEHRSSGEPSQKVERSVGHQPTAKTCTVASVVCVRSMEVSPVVGLGFDRKRYPPAETSMVSVPRSTSTGEVAAST